MSPSPAPRPAARPGGPVVYLVPAPIGTRMDEVSAASEDALRAVRHVFVESDGRVVRKLTEAGVLGPEHRIHLLDTGAAPLAAKLLDEGNDLALLSDSGIPCFVDPGHQIVAAVLERPLGTVTLVPVGMSSALDAVLAMAGLDIQRFHFVGHYPENYGFGVARLDRLPIVLYVAGRGVRTFALGVRRALPNLLRVTLFRNVACNGGGQVFRWYAGEPVPDAVVDDPRANYAALVERATLTVLLRRRRQLRG